MPDGALLAFIAGCADALGLLHFNTFAGAMTGNTAFLGLRLLSPHPAQALLYLSVIAAFCAGVALAQAARRLGVAPRPVLALPILVLIGCNLGRSRWIAAALALAMGVQNGAARDFAMTTLNTTFLTGDLHKLMDALATCLLPTPPRRGADPRELGAVGFAWGGYVAGAVLGVASNRWLALPFLVPAGLLLLFVLCANIPKSAQS